MSSTIVTVILLSLAVVILFATSIASARKAKRAIKRRIVESWAKDPSERYKEEELQSISSYFINRKNEQKSTFTIDDVTWHDLDMDEVFIRLNNTGSTPGEETLYRLLREPSFVPETLTRRQKLIEFIQSHRSDRVAIQTILARLGKKRLINVTDYFFHASPRQPWKAMLYRLLSILALLAPLFLFFNTGLGVLLILVSLVTNMIVYYNARSEIGLDLGILSYVVRVVRCMREIINARIAGLGELNGTLATCFSQIKTIERRTFFLFFISTGSLADILTEYIKIILLRELIEYEYLLKVTFEHRHELMEVYEAIGLIDSLISVASYRESVPFYVTPNLVKQAAGGGNYLGFQDSYHPLLKDPVLNSLSMHGPLLVTGSNASGKSTFLKTVAINAIFAQSICTCLAREYSSCFYAVFSSMALRDSLRNGESYFIAEIKSIKRILDYLNEKVPCLCLIDEVLRGTNTVERIAASSQVLLHLAKHKCMCMAATHDVELTHILEKYFQNVHFQERIADNSIVFDYKLYEGRASSRNAIKLLRLMGYDDAIVTEAERRANDFMNRGTWKEISG
jgi:DNA mismatch repair ATPase MutS